MARVFIYEGREFPDPDPNLSADEVRQMMTSFFPELANAEIREHARDGDTLHELVRRVGTKGTMAVSVASVMRCPNCGGLAHAKGWNQAGNTNWYCSSCYSRFTTWHSMVVG